MTMCAPCGLDGPCGDDSCDAIDPGVYRCAACTAPHGSPEAARACAEWDDDVRAYPFTD